MKNKPCIAFLALTSKDAVTTSVLLKKEEIECIICKTIEEFCKYINEGADAALLTQESILFDKKKLIMQALKDQPAWSDFPLVILTSNNRMFMTREKELCSIGNVTLLDRPVPIHLLISSLKIALRDRGRQYNQRDYINEILAKEKELIKAKYEAEEANRTKSNFLANMSHEIRTPINVVVGIANLLDQSNLSQKHRDFVNTLKLSANSLLELINDLLDISKIESYHFELEQAPFSIKKVMYEVCQLIDLNLKEKKLILKENIDTLQEEYFIGDVARIRQILLNICSNAVKFTDQGVIEIDISCKNTSSLDIKELQILIKDSGIGIESKYLESIFEKFSQVESSSNRRYGGTGLGLSITKMLVELMGGKIFVDSTLGIGSTFCINLPLKLFKQEETIKEIINIKKEDCVPEKNISVLVIDDYEPNITMTSFTLEEYGYYCETALSGKKALDKIKEHQFDVILMDIQMPEMDGFETTSQIRNFERKHYLTRTPIIAMTAHALKGVKEKCLNANMDDYISKPFEPTQLDQLIKKITS